MKYTIEMREEFDCPQSIEDAFNYIVDFTNIHEWDHTVLSSKKVSDEAVIGLGSKFDLVLSMGKRRVPLAYEITDYKSPNKAVLTGISANFTAVDTVTLNHTASGCHVSWNADIEFTGLSALIVRFMSKKIKTSGAQTIRDLESKLANTG
jgi:hypothetical protein